MSHVAAVTLFYNTLGDDESEARLLADVNTFFAPYRGLVDVTERAGGNKHPQIQVAIGGFNYLDIDGFLAYLRGMDWAKYETYHVQVAIQDEHDCGVGLVDIYRDPNAESAWSE